MKQRILAALALLSVCSCVLTDETRAPNRAAAKVVIVNGQRLPDQTVQALEQGYHVRIRPGAYWYDRLTGAWGFWGGPVAGVIHPGLNLGGPLAENASNGNTGIFINGRQLHQRDVWILRQITIPLPGRYWMDAYGTFGYVAGPAIGNVYWLANTASRRGGGNTVRRQGILSTYDKTGWPCSVTSRPRDCHCITGRNLGPVFLQYPVYEKRKSRSASWNAAAGCAGGLGSFRRRDLSAGLPHSAGRARAYLQDAPANRATDTYFLTAIYH